MTDQPFPNLASPKFKAGPYPFYAHLRAASPVVAVTLPDGQSAWLVTRYDDVLAVLKDERFGKEAASVGKLDERFPLPWIPSFVKPLARNMLDLDGADHTRLRMLVHKGFTPRLIEQLRGRIQSVCDGLIDDVGTASEMDLIRAYALPLPVTIIAELLGIPPKDRHRFSAWSKPIVGISAAKDLIRALPAMWQFVRYLRQLVELRRADPQDDLITALVQAEEAGDSLTGDELLAMVFLLLIAGHETTVNLIASGTLALLQQPEALDQLRREPALMKPAVEELLRFTSPVDIATERYAMVDLEFAGTRIARGDLVHAVLGSANRDAAQFPDADRLDLARDPNRHLAFGMGIHYCLGAPLARLEGQIAFETLLRRLPHLRLAARPESLRWRKSLFLRGLERLPVAF